MDVLDKVIGLFAGRTDLLQLEIGDHDPHGRRQHGHDDHHGNDAQQQDGKGVVVIVDFVFEGERVEHHLHLHGAQGAEFGQVGHPCHGQIVKPQPLYQGDQQRFDQLAVADVAKAPDHKGELGKDVAPDECLTEPL